MRKLPLYAGGLYSPGQRVEPEAIDRGCDRCVLADKARHPCMPAAGEPGGLLIVADFPTADEDRVDRPWISRAAKFARDVVAEHYRGPVAYDYAVRCAPSRAKIKTVRDGVSVLRACRPYHAGVLEEVEPERVVVLGAIASRQVLGRNVSVHGTRRTYSWLADPLGRPAIPVFVLPPAALVMRNPFHKRDFAEDLAWALTVDVGDLQRPPHGRTYGLIETVEDAEEAERAMCEAPWVAVDAEWAGRPYNDDFRLLSAACAVPPGWSDVAAWVWPQAELYRDLAPGGALAQVLENPDVPLVGASFKSDMQAFAAAGVRCRGLRSDIRLRRKILEPEASGALDDMTEIVGHGGHKEEAEQLQSKAVTEIRKRLTAGEDLQRGRWPLLTEAMEERLRGVFTELGAKVGREKAVPTYKYALLPPEVLHRYNALDAATTAVVDLELDARHGRAADELRRVWPEVVRGGTAAIARVEEWGVAASTDAIDMFESYLRGEYEQAERELRRYADINWGSDPQVADYFFNKKKARVTHKTDGGGPSVKREALEILAERYPEARLKLRFNRADTNLKFAAGMRAHVQDDGRIHCSFNLDGARSGRTSSSGPNLQNIPSPEKDPEIGTLARNVFVAPAGRYLVQFDYKQLELVVAAILSGDEKMRAIFHEGVDYHLRSAQLLAPILWGKKPEEIEDKGPERRWTKAFNFGMLYGQGDETIARNLGVKVEDARRLRRAVYGEFRDLARWIKEELNRCRKTGETWTWWGGRKFRRRPMAAVASRDDKERSRAENGAHNTPIQGTASEFCVASLAAIVEWLVGEDEPSKLVLTVHDSVVLEVPEGDVDRVAARVVDIMTGWDSDGVPLRVDVEMGAAWGGLEKVDVLKGGLVEQYRNKVAGKAERRIASG